VDDSATQASTHDVCSLSTYWARTNKIDKLPALALFCTRQSFPPTSSVAAEDVCAGVDSTELAVAASSLAAQLICLLDYLSSSAAVAAAQWVVSTSTHTLPQLWYAEDGILTNIAV
jgi:hypothetical protein